MWFPEGCDFKRINHKDLSAATPQRFWDLMPPHSDPPRTPASVHLTPQRKTLIWPLLISSSIEQGAGQGRREGGTSEHSRSAAGRAILGTNGFLVRKG